MPSETKPASRLTRGILLSLVCHGAILACVLLLGFASSWNFFHPVQSSDRAFLHISEIQIAGSSHAIKFPLPPDPAAARIHDPDRNADPVKKTILPVPKEPKPRNGGGTPPNPHDSKGSGQTMAGNGPDDQNATPAFPVFSPKPPVTDRALLPGSEKKIVVDVDVNEQGGVVSETLVTGLGNKLDQIVLETVKSWRFHPATVNGKPVATQAELVFPFNQQYPVGDS